MNVSRCRRARSLAAICSVLAQSFCLAGCHGGPAPESAADAAGSRAHEGGSEVDASTEAGGGSVDAAQGQSDAGASDGGYVPPPGGNTLWIGNSLVRHGAGGSYPAYDVPSVVQDLHAASGRGALVEMRVLAQDGFDLSGWWVTWYGYTRDGVRISAARAIAEDGAAARSYDVELGYTRLPPGQRWNRIILLSTANIFVEAPERWYGSLDSGAVVPNMERWYQFVRDVDPAIEILHYEGIVDARIIERQPEVDRLYDELEARWHGRIVPVGRAFASAVRARPALDLRRTHDNDYMHFSQPGVYLAACVFFAVLYGDPTGLPVTSGLDVSATDAAFLQRIARDAVAAVGSGAP